MQVKIAVISIASIAAAISTSVFAIGLGVQIGAGSDASVHTGARSAVAATTQAPAQVQLRAPVQHSATASASTQVQTDAHVIERQRSGDVARSVIKAETDMSTEAARSISASEANKAAAVQTTRAEAKAGANIGAAVKGYGAAPENSSVGANASTKVRVSGS
jgi:hypothetical protein